MHKFAKIFVWLGLLFFGSISLFALYNEYGFPWKHGEKREVMEQFLEEKYQDEFTFDALRFDLMHGRNYYTYATAKSTNVSFYIEVSPDNTVEEAYAYEYWNAQISDIFYPLLKPTLKQFESISGQVFLNAPATISTNPKENATFLLSLVMGMELTEENREEQVARWMITIDKLREEDYSLEAIEINYYNDTIYLDRERLRGISTIENLSPYFK